MSWLLSLIIYIAEGALAGWIASKIMGGSLSLGMCIIVGIVGSIIGGFLAGLIGIGGGFIVSMLVAIIGACLLIWLALMITRSR